MIAEEQPTILPFNQNAWAEHTDYGRRKLSQALETMRILRADNYQLLKELPEETFSKTGIHPERGTLSLLDLLRGFAHHSESHAGQIREARAAYKASRGK
jgi:hypothetical protein